MEFSFEYFKQSPTVEALYTCRKSDLILVADYYDITISKGATKKVIRDVVQENLVADGVLIIEPKSRDVDAVSGTDGDKAEASAQFPTVDPNPLLGLNTADLKLAIQLKELDLRVKQQEHDTQLLRVRQCELEARRVSPRPVSGLQTPMTSVPSVSPVVSPVPHTPGTGEVDISRQIRLVPIFRETEIDSYFSAFERIAAALHWPKEIWSLLLQCRLTGKAQEVSAALSIEDSLDYDILKASVLRAYELVPEAYRQKIPWSFKSCQSDFCGVCP